MPKLKGKAVVVFLASPETSHVTETVLNVDGGFSA